MTENQRMINLTKEQIKNLQMLLTKQKSTKEMDRKTNMMINVIESEIEGLNARIKKFIEEDVA
ncbi:hypothetical protein D3C72_2482420 [compost metagenome]